MSEGQTANASPASAPNSAGANPQPTAAPAPAAANPGNPGPAQSANPQPAAGDAAQVAEMRRMLGEQDFDAEVPLKIDGKEKSAKLRDIVAEYQRRESATQRYQEAARLRQEADARAAALTQALQDPSRFRQELQAMGMSPRELAERVLQQEIEEASLSPEQRERRQLQAELEQLRAVREQEVQRQVQAKAQELRGQYAHWFSERMTEAGIPDSPQLRGLVLGELVQYLDAAIQAGTSVPPSEMRQLASQVYGQIVGQWRQSLTEADRRAMLTPEDWAWYQQQKAGSVPQAMPAAKPHHAQEQPRDEQGKFAPNGRPIRRVFDGDAGFARLLNGGR